MLKVMNLTKTFGGLTAVNDVSFEVQKGEIIGIIGPNGSGKSTLFEVISGFYRPTSGQVSLKGKRIDGLKPHQIFSQGLTRTFQLLENYNSLTVNETIQIPLLSSSGKKNGSMSPEKLLESLNFGAELSSPFSHLSLPDRHIVEFTRVLISHPDIVLLDEVMSGLNPEQIKLFASRIKKERENGISFLVIEHYLETVMSLCDRLIVLELGRKMIEDTPEKVIANKNVMSSYLGIGANNAIPA